MQLAYYYNQTRCMACGACVVACKDWNDVPSGPASWLRVTTTERGAYPNVFVSHNVRPCYQCANPRCMAVCPTGAISKREEDGIVIVDQDKCRTAAPGCGIIVGQSYGEQQAPCKIKCPAHLSASAYLALIANGKFEDALEVIRDQVTLPGTVGRVCHHPCETVCKRQEVDEPIAICDLKRFVSDHVVVEQTNPIPITKLEKVAIIGSGPAGLSAAHYLAKKGYGVTIFEALPEAGGMLMFGIPEFRLPKDVVKREIDYIKGLGVEIRTNTQIGSNLTLDDLRSHHGYDAVFIATGAHKTDSLGIPGADLGNVLDGVSLLRNINLGKKPKITDRVVVVGGGNVAIDSARSALRLGAKEVTIIYRRTHQEMPANPVEVEEAEREGVRIDYLVAPLELIEKDGRVGSVRCIRTQLGEPDTDGRCQPIPVKDSEFEMETDLVISAVGESPDLSFLGNTKLQLVGDRDIAVNTDTGETSYPGIFAGGDVTGRAGYVIDSIAQGKKAAEAIDQYLQHSIVLTVPFTATCSKPIEWGDAAEIKVDIPKEIKKQERQKAVKLDLSKRKGNFDEVVIGITKDAAISEAQRCLNCGGHLCLEVCPYDSPQFGDEENAKMQKCNLCVDRWAEGKKPTCVAACPTRALDAGPIEEMESKYGSVREAASFTYSDSLKPSVLFKPKPETVAP